ncbi:putative ATP-dependent carboligase, ATP-grasp superfamily [Dehalogenimonas formicexedens]|uniref:Putative ATP-dependent carboligase, ATP-grasp superfamily n=1 Tax=Dehalogenimonas formicexedens TaxID=1839801 RepID=A0A1P8F8H4_9CHLR|nr:PAC2 family protein [Dehalogenimonas formicexedens]APV44702.1 putative ATP-dependent carboligase, ATP-grasp superfamily [Dehalogenimonas formicexedens]
MKISLFDSVDPVPELKNPHVFVTIPPWLNAGESARLAVEYLEKLADAQPLAQISVPGEFFDFTRYRPTVSMVNGESKIEIPNAIARFGSISASDFIFLRAPEPHMRSEQYIESILELLKHFNVKRYCLLGSMYEMLPYTRPPFVTSSASNQLLQNSIEVTGAVPGNYEGPTSIMSLLAQEARRTGIETLSLVVHLPIYLPVPADHRGEVRLLEICESLYGIEVPGADLAQAKEENEQVTAMAEAFLKEHPQLRFMLTQLEDNYDARVKNREQVRLSPEIERFLQDMSRGFEAG